MNLGKIGISTAAKATLTGVETNSTNASGALTAFKGISTAVNGILTAFKANMTNTEMISASVEIRCANGVTNLSVVRRGRGAIFLAVLTTCVLATTPAEAQMPVWTQQPVSGPSARKGHSMTYDAARGTVVLFGGAAQSGTSGIFNGDTWEWDGIAWMQRSVTGPVPRFVHATAYDSARGVTVLFGGAGPSGGSSVFFGDTWEWNGNVWTQRTVTGPSARFAPAMVYDEARHVTVLFGGLPQGAGAPFISDTWEWNGTAWIQRSVGGPSPRWAHSMVYDSARGVIVLFGGSTDRFNPVPNGETWEWNGTVWTQRLVSGPSPRMYAALAYDPSRAVTLLFGGYTGVSPYYSGETWEWNGAVWSQRMVAGPSRRSCEMVYDSVSHKTLLFGGEVGSPNYQSGETWDVRFLPCTCVTDFDDGTGAGRCDGGVTIDDLLFYLGLYPASDLRADIDDGSGTGTPDGGVTIEDLLYYLVRFNSGC